MESNPRWAWPAVTTDLSGFGAYVQHHLPDAAREGVTVLNRARKASTTPQMRWRRICSSSFSWAGEIGLS
jgi:hypothetical protein